MCPNGICPRCGKKQSKFPKPALWVDTEICNTCYRDELINGARKERDYVYKSNS